MTDRRGYHFLCLQSWATTKTVTHPSMHCGLLQTWKPYKFLREFCSQILDGMPRVGTFHSGSLKKAPILAKSLRQTRPFKFQTLRRLIPPHRISWECLRLLEVVSREESPDTCPMAMLPVGMMIESCHSATLCTGRQLILARPEKNLSNDIQYCF